MQRRIKYEIIQLNKKYSNLDISGNIININNKKFILDNDYPFRSPQVFINNIKYNKYLSIPFDITIKLNKTKYKYKCLCCNTILCSWNPTYKIEHILEEIEEFTKIINEIKYNILLDRIGKKYNIINIIKLMIIEFLI